MSPDVLGWLLAGGAVLLVGAAIFWPSIWLRGIVALGLTCSVLVREFFAPVVLRRMVAQAIHQGSIVGDLRDLPDQAGAAMSNTSSYVVVPVLLLFVLVLRGGKKGLVLSPERNKRQVTALPVSRGDWKRVLLALLCGIVIQAALIGLAIILKSGFPIWNVALAGLLAGPGPTIGYTAEGQPLTEGTPVHFAFAVAGVIFGVILYAAISYYALRWLSRRRASS